jgi:FAD/FMN-containing dehydrogenase
VIAPGSPGFAAAARVYNERFDHVVPRAVARPLDTADVSGAVRWAVANGVPLRARSGGHSYAGYSTIAGGVVLDLRTIKHVSISSDGSAATVGAGAQLIDVYAALAARGRTIPAGSCPSVGIGGHALGGGMGLAGRAFGLTTDNLVAVRLVTADGAAVQVDESSDPDMLWALRGGGGGNFGVATEFVLRLHPAPPTASWFIASWPWSLAADALAAWQAWAPHAPDDLTSIFHLETGVGSPAVSVAGQYLGSAAALPRLLAPITALGGSLSSGQESYLALQLRWAGCAGLARASCHTAGVAPGGTLPRADFAAKSDYVSSPLPRSARDALVHAIELKQGQPGSGAILFDAYGGAINRISPDATAFIHRSALCCIQYLAYDGGAPWLAETWARMRRYVSGMAYQNYIDPELSSWRQAYYGTNYPRLVATQRRVDPNQSFRFPQAIGS